MKALIHTARRHADVIYFLALSMLIFLPLLGNGYILTLDMTFTPEMNFDYPTSQGLFNELPRDSLLFLLAKVFPAWILQKLILLGIFFAAGYLMYRFLLSILPEKKRIAIAAATLYVWNPFTMTRLLAGQWAMLAGYALTPLFILLLPKYLSARKISSKLLVLTGACWFGASLISIHHLLLFGLPVLIYTAMRMLNNDKWWRPVKRAFLLFLLVFLLSLSWLLPSFLVNDLTKLNGNNLHFFAPNPDLKYGLSFNLFSFYGFWAEDNLGVLPKDVNSIWWFIFLVISLIAALPVIKVIINFLKKRFAGSYNKENRFLIVFLVLTGIASLLLAHGNTGFMQPVWDIFYQRVPLLQPLRESQKFLNLYIFSFSTLSFFGLVVLNSLISNLHNKLKESKLPELLLTFSFIFMTVLYTPNLAFAGKGQLKLTSYPASWYALQKEINSSPAADAVLVLPWQAYNTLPFIGRQSADPATSFFNGFILQAKQPKELTSDICDLEYNSRHRGRNFFLCLNYEDAGSEWIKQIRENGINYILVHKTLQTPAYPFLKNQEVFELFIEDESAIIYKIK